MPYTIDLLLSDHCPALTPRVVQMIRCAWWVMAEQDKGDAGGYTGSKRAFDGVDGDLDHWFTDPRYGSWIFRNAEFMPFGPEELQRFQAELDQKKEALLKAAEEFVRPHPLHLSTPGPMLFTADRGRGLPSTARMEDILAVAKSAGGVVLHNARMETLAQCTVNSHRQLFHGVKAVYSRSLDCLPDAAAVLGVEMPVSRQPWVRPIGTTNPYQYEVVYGCSPDVDRGRSAESAFGELGMLADAQKAHRAEMLREGPSFIVKELCCEE